MPHFVALTKKATLCCIINFATKCGRIEKSNNLLHFSAIHN